MRAPAQRGHTLLELLVAVVVTALIAAGGYAGLSAIARASAAHRQEVRQLEAVQWFVSRLDRDLFHAINRPVRGEFGSQAALSGNITSLSLTHSGLSNPLHQPRSELQRVDWILSGESIYRHTRPVLDGPVSADSAEQLLNDILALSIEYLGNANRWHGRWPAGTEDGLPRAVRYRLEIRGFGNVERLVELPGQRT
jgi:general secretion pathway protein J